jgi:hypothetical protein
MYALSATHRYLMSRLSLQVFYLWRNVLSTAPPFILWWSNLEILFALLHWSSHFTGGLRCQAIQTEHGPVYSRKNQKAVYIVRCLCWYSIASVHNNCTRTIATIVIIIIVYCMLRGKINSYSYSYSWWHKGDFMDEKSALMGVWYGHSPWRFLDIYQGFFV